MKNNNSHPVPDMYAEDMPVETLDILRLAAQVTKMVNEKNLNCKFFQMNKRYIIWWILFSMKWYVQNKVVAQI